MLYGDEKSEFYRDKAVNSGSLIFERFVRFVTEDVFDFEDFFCAALVLKL